MPEEELPVTEIATTKMSSKGQVIIPEAIRKKMKLKPGDRFVVVGAGDAVILKSITPPDMDQFEALLSEARRQARRAGLKSTDIAAVVKAIRGSK
jgi:AbrB family looped-hinge helix DNA binding protein